MAKVLGERGRRGPQGGKKGDAGDVQGVKSSDLGVGWIWGWGWDSIRKGTPPPALALSWPLSGGGKAKVIPRREHGVGGGDMSLRRLRGSVHLQLGYEAQRGGWRG